MTVSTFVQPNKASDSPSAYPSNIDAAIAVLTRLAAAFAPHAQATPNMTVRVDAGSILVGTTLTEVAAQNTGTIAAPATNPRIDRVVVDQVTGAVSVLTGAEAASPSPPALTAGQRPVAQVLLQTSSTVIANAMITDERQLPTAAISAYVAANWLTLTDRAGARAALGAPDLERIARRSRLATAILLT